MFVYGTLRTGGYLNSMYLSVEEAATARPAKMPGRLYSVGSFPVMVPDHRCKEGYLYVPIGMVVGEIIEVEPSTFRRIATMEMRAGYYVDSVPAVRTTTDGGREWCLVFLVEPEEAEGLERLPGDDWNREDELDDRPGGRGFMAG